ncbi:MAG: arginine--tRNA ligase [Bacteroidetes bacterium]|nr:MAG: arginine--tRNA ligase [Bacteroidota bacterium]
MSIFKELQSAVSSAMPAVFSIDIDPSSLLVQPTRKDFVGDYTIVIFPFVKLLRKSPEAVGEMLGQYLVDNDDKIEAFNVVKGFLNLSLSDSYWSEQLYSMSATSDWWKQPSQSGRVMIEFSSPNTNKPLHLGHIRNILLGWSMSRILEAVGKEVVRVQIINDRGIAICKSMLSWQLYSGQISPEEANVKSDHFVGEWYVRFEQEFLAEYLVWQESDSGREVFDEADEPDAEIFFKKYKNTYFNKFSLLGGQAREMLLKWEAGDTEVHALWAKMNSWVYAGFDQTYERLGVSFDKLYYESQTYLLGRSMVEEGLSKEVFFTKEDGSVWVDLTDAGMDEKILLRSDGTSVYLTQDLGTAQLRYDDFGAKEMIYVVADEQNYHFNVLFESLKKLGVPFADGLNHLSYGMVDLPTGRMKTREGRVVDADDLMDEVYAEAKKETSERGEIVDLTEEEQDDVLRKISLAAMKYFIIKVDPKRRMIFNPAESVDMQGQTGPYIQYAYVRVQSILRKAAEAGGDDKKEAYDLADDERSLLAQLYAFTSVVDQAAELFNPGLIANYCYQLAKTLHRYMHDYRVLTAESETARHHRLLLIKQIGEILKAGMELLGIEMPERM